ncbi:MAG: tRNA guanosine(15) transglycosylase TgtA [Fervidicoccaceae archaeon]
MKILDRDLAGRIGRLEARGSSIETPYLFPVVDPVRQELSVEEIKDLGFRGVITNAYLAYKRGWRGRIHDLLASRDILVMTDSGAYQLLQYGEVEVSNREIIEIEKMLDSDIAVILDVPTGDSLNREYAEWTVNETLRRAKEAAELIDRGKRLWVLPIQGGLFLDLVEKSARESAELDFDIYALGSPTRFMERYQYEALIDMIRAARSQIPAKKPLHLFGAGHPMIIPFAVAMGIDLFDSASYILFARDGRYMTEHGTMRLERLSYFPCSCPICSKYTPAELREMKKEERTRLLAKHNLLVVRRIINETKEAIKEGRLWELLISMSRGHPSLLSLLRRIEENHSSWMELYTPSTKGGGKSTFIFEDDSRKNPRIARMRKFIAEEYKPPGLFRKLAIVPIYFRIPDARSRGEEYLVYYAPAIGAVPAEISGIYPIGQGVYQKAIGEAEQIKIARDITEFLEKFGQMYEEIEMRICREHEALLQALKDTVLKKIGVRVRIVDESCFSVQMKEEDNTFQEYQ